MSNERDPHAASGYFFVAAAALFAEVAAHTHKHTYNVSGLDDFSLLMLSESVRV